MSGVVLLVAACGSADRPDPSTQTIDRSAVVARIMSHCTDLPSPGLGAGTLCIDNGFRLRTDDFSFANWGRSVEADANVTVQNLIDMFGPDHVCAPGGTTGECIPRPGTLQQLEEWNTALSGGRCEGMAALAVRFRLGQDDPSQFSTGAATVAELSRNDGRLGSWIAYWWATQFLEQVADRAAESRLHSPVELLDELVQGLADGKVGYTLGLYHGAGGHSVVPFAVTRRASVFVVHVYDNNHPRERREIVVDPATDRWTYTDANPDETWSGGTGTFELTLMSSREGPFTCPFCTVPRKGSPTIVTIASRDADAPGYVLLRSGHGSVESSPDGISNTIDGAIASPAKGAGATITISIPQSVGGFSVALRRGNGAVPAGDVVVTVRRPGHAATQVSGNLADLVVGDTADDAVLRVGADDTTVTAPRSAVARVSIDAGSNIVRRRLRAGETIVLDRTGTTGIEIALKGGGRATTGRATVPVHAGAVTSQIDIVDDGGAVVLTESAVVPLTVRAPADINYVPRRRAATTTTIPPVNSIVVSEPD